MSNPPFVYQSRSYLSEETQRQIYLLLCQSVPAMEIAQRVDVCIDTVHRFRRRFGISTHYSRRWTQKEDWELSNLVDQNLHIDVIAKKLHRTVQAVQRRISDNGIQRIWQNHHTYTIAQVSRMLRVGIYRISRWIDRGLLQATRIAARYSTERRSYYRVRSIDLYDFLVQPRYWHLYRVDDITDDWLRRDLVAVQRETPRWLYIEDIATRYVVSLNAVRHWCVSNKIPYELIIRTHVFDPEQLKDWTPPYARDRSHATHRPAANGNGPCHDGADERRRLEGGGAPGDKPAKTHSATGGGCASSALPELAEATK